MCWIFFKISICLESQFLWFIKYLLHVKVNVFFRGGAISVLMYYVIILICFLCLNLLSLRRFSCFNLAVLNISMYAEDLWLSRSFFVLERHLLLCMEDFMQFGSLIESSPHSSYFSLDSCCSIVDVQELVSLFFGFLESWAF